MKSTIALLLVLGALIGLREDSRAASGGTGGFPAKAVLFSGPGGRYAVNADGSGLRRLPTGGLLSPDGRWTAFVRCQSNCLNADSGTGVYDLLVSRVEGGRTRRVGTWREAEWPAGYAWSPDGRRLAYSEQRFGWTRILDARSGRLLAQIAAAWNPEWSPDGRRLTVRARDGLYTVRPDGSARSRIGDAFDASWSPDSARLVVSEGDALHVVAATGRGRQLLVRAADLPAATASADISWHPEWSPRGDLIAFVAAPESGDWGVHLVRPDGSGLHRVLAPGRWGHVRDRLAWSRDGRYLAATTVSARHSTSVVISDVVVVEVASGSSRRLTQGWRYGSENVAAQWHPRGFPAQSLGGRATGPVLPTDTVVRGQVLETTRVVDRLSADGSRVAYTFAPPTYTGYYGRGLYRTSALDCAESWDPTASSVIRLRAPCSGTPWGPAGIGVAGSRLAWVENLLGPIAGSNSVSVYTGTAELPRPSIVLQTGNAPSGDLVGDGELLVFDTWARNGACTGSSCYEGPKRDSVLYRLAGETVVRIASSAGSLTPLSVDAGRILVDRGEGLLELMTPDGASLRTFQLNAALVRGARHEGRDLVVLTPNAVEVTDAETGAFLRRWPSPSPDARLVDVHDGVAVLVVPHERVTDVHFVSLAHGGQSGKEIPFAGPVHAQLEAPGLFYSYRVEDATYPGRVAFVPFDELPLR